MLWFDDNFNKKVLWELKTKIKNFSEFKELTLFLYWDSKIPDQDLLANQKMKITDIDMVKKISRVSTRFIKTKKVWIYKRWWSKNWFCFCDIGSVNEKMVRFYGLQE